jgi:hypothetical protein
VQVVRSWLILRGCGVSSRIAHLTVTVTRGWDQNVGHQLVQGTEPSKILISLTPVHIWAWKGDLAVDAIHIHFVLLTASFIKYIYIYAANCNTGTGRTGQDV